MDARLIASETTLRLNSSKQLSSVLPILPGDFRPLMPVSKLSLVLIIQVIATDEA